MALIIKQFGFNKLLTEQQAVIESQPNMLDCRSIPNPFKRGVSEASMKASVRSHPVFRQLVERGVKTLYQYGELYVGCAYGVHRSGAVAEAIAERTGAVIERLT